MYSKPRRKAFTLLEALIAAALMALIFLGTIGLFLETSRSTHKLHGTLWSSRMASKTLQQLSLELQEAYGAIVPSDTQASNALSWDPNQLGPLRNYQSTNPGEPGWPATLDTAVYVLAPPQGSATVKDELGDRVTPTGLEQPHDRASRSVLRGVLIFRGNPDGSTNPGFGSCLWAWYFDNGVCTQRVRLTATISSAWNAVSFTRTGISQRHIVVKLVCGEGSYPFGEQTSESSDGITRVTPLSGRYVLMANAALLSNLSVTFPLDPNLLPSPNTATPVPGSVSSPSVTPTPVAVSTPASTPTPTSGSTPTTPPTPTPQPTPTPIPTPTPTPSPQPTPIPIG